MSVSQVPIRPIAKGSLTRFWLAIAALVAAAVGLAWWGTVDFRGEVTPSGLVFRTVEPGEGDFIKPVDGALVEYEGRLTDGTVFDSTEGRGPAPMIAGQMIPGFSEAMQKMQKGGRYHVRIPASQAYGATPPPGGPIPANADLEFDVHIVQVVPNAALMMAGQAGAEPGAQPGAEPGAPPPAGAAPPPGN